MAKETIGRVCTSGSGGAFYIHIDTERPRASVWVEGMSSEWMTADEADRIARALLVAAAKVRDAGRSEATP